MKHLLYRFLTRKQREQKGQWCLHFMIITGPLLIYSLLFWSAMAHAQSMNVSSLPDQIWVFYNQKNPVDYTQLQQAHPVHHYDLDQVDIIEQQFSMGLSASPEQARERALERIRNLRPTQIEQLKQAYTGIVTAWQMQIKRLPAIVFDYDGRQYVIYGQRDGQRALQEFQKWQKNH